MRHAQFDEEGFVQQAGVQCHYRAAPIQHCIQVGPIGPYVPAFNGSDRLVTCTPGQQTAMSMCNHCMYWV